MIDLDVSIEYKGQMIFVGKITGTNYIDATFAYDKEYLDDENTSAISISLPLRKESFSPKETKSFFSSLLPEGFVKGAVANYLHVDEDDYLSMLSILGKECIGAIKISDTGEKGLDQKFSYKKLTKADIKKIAIEGVKKSSDYVVASRMSLAGASAKVGLYYDEKKAKWYLPCDGAPSSHIVKQSHVRYEDIVINEQLCLLTAKRLGIKTAQSIIIDSDEKKLLFASRRFDRAIDESCKSVDGLLVPRRLHQEDFAQALGISSENKYEKMNDRYLPLMFDVIKKYSFAPIEDALLLWDMLIFNYLIGNTDCHLKNFSLTYTDSLKSPRLSPAYDVISTVIYKEISREMSFAINDKRDIGKITRDDFTSQSKIVGIGKTVALEHFDRLSNNFESALNASVKELTSLGFKDAKTIKNRIIKERKK